MITHDTLFFTFILFCFSLIRVVFVYELWIRCFIPDFFFIVQLIIWLKVDLNRTFWWMISFSFFWYFRWYVSLIFIYYNYFGFFFINIFFFLIWMYRVFSGFNNCGDAPFIKVFQMIFDIISSVIYVWLSIVF